MNVSFPQQTHEEAICSMVAGMQINSDQLPLMYYQMTPKFRDEPRPRHALLRSLLHRNQWIVLPLIILVLPYGDSQIFKTLPMNENVQATFLRYSGNVTAVF